VRPGPLPPIERALEEGGRSIAYTKQTRGPGHLASETRNPWQLTALAGGPSIYGGASPGFNREVPVDDDQDQDRRTNPLTRWVPQSRKTITVFDVALFGGDAPTLRCGLLLDEQGYPGEVVMALGTGQGRTWKEAPELGGLTLPATCLPSLLGHLYHLDRIRRVLSDIPGEP